MYDKVEENKVDKNKNMSRRFFSKAALVLGAGLGTLTVAESLGINLANQENEKNHSLEDAFFDLLNAKDFEHFKLLSVDFLSKIKNNHTQSNFNSIYIYSKGFVDRTKPKYPWLEYNVKLSNSATKENVVDAIGSCPELTLSELISALQEAKIEDFSQIILTATLETQSTSQYGEIQRELSIFGSNDWVFYPFPPTLGLTYRYFPDEKDKTKFIKVTKTGGYQINLDQQAISYSFSEGLYENGVEIHENYGYQMYDPESLTLLDEFNSNSNSNNKNCKAFFEEIEQAYFSNSRNAQ